MDYPVKPKKCRQKHVKTLDNFGRWICLRCKENNAQLREDLERERLNLPPLVRATPTVRPKQKLCRFGHVKEARGNNDMRCRVCERNNSARRNADAREAQGRPRAPKKIVMEPTGEFCKLGHEKMRNSHGDVRCRECVKIQRARAKEEAGEQRCEHAYDEKTQWVLSRKRNMVCLTCVINRCNASDDAEETEDTSVG